MAKKKKESKAGITAQEIRGKSADELGTLLVDSKKELFNIRFQQTAGEPVAAHRPRVLRKTIARIKTIQNQNNKPAAPAKKAAIKSKRGA
jgi:large subunit ribosomal protein L29